MMEPKVLFFLAACAGAGASARVQQEQGETDDSYVGSSMKRATA